MLIKLLKYETKATARSFIPIYIAIILTAFINRMINPFVRVGNTFTTTVEGFSLLSIIHILSGFAYFGLVVAVIALTFVIAIQRFYQNLLEDEGYLMFTLPVKPWQHIVSKLLVSILWVVLSFTTILCSILILINVDNLFEEITNIINSARYFLGDSIFFMIPVFGLIMATYFIMTIYNALSIGHLFPKHKVLASFGAFGIIYAIRQILFAVFIFLTINKYSIHNYAPDPLTAIPPEVTSFIFSIAILYILYGAINFIIANFILSKKLNLQ